MLPGTCRKIQNGSCFQTSGMVSNNREEVWIYEYPWPEKTEVNSVVKLEKLILNLDDMHLSMLSPRLDWGGGLPAGN